MDLCPRLLILTLAVTSCSAHNDVFSSIGHMTDLLWMEKDLVKFLKDYIRAENDKLQKVKEWVARLDVLSAVAIEQPEDFLSHPVNAYKLVKRLNTEWKDLEKLVLTDVTNVFISKLSVMKQNFPTDEDQSGAAKALLRLQDTYQLDTHTLSTGRLPGSSGSAPLSVDECYDVGRVAYSESDFYHAALWMKRALELLEDKEVSTRGEALHKVVDVLDYLSFSVYQQGALQDALYYTRRLLHLDPTHQRASSNLKYFEYQLFKQKKMEMGEGDDDKEVNGQSGGRRGDQQPERRQYEHLCRGEGLQMTPRRQSRLLCRYHDNGRHPRYVIGPVKQEDEWDHPHIVRYHDIVTEKEMQKIKELAKPRLKRATVHDPLTGRLITAPYRVSKSAWLGAGEHPVVEKINQRIEDVTGLDVSTAEDLQVLLSFITLCWRNLQAPQLSLSMMQVANYGVGGQYEPHFDFGRKDEPDAFEELGMGNRVATWLLYMSDIPAGGATVFTDIGAAIWPKKGSAVFWFNLHPSGEGDYRTRHAACPVLVGNKWARACLIGRLHHSLPYKERS
ncbi:prolyl 4-hydroxylase subunit alpha-1-like isoform X2 [Gouania willdenowi]|uniref:prolyl 4-hydroxylase subunit alpha-1-like isoform X2 n=1 Tax=Gouania willdenowi TaxID=441366 RepID=UPI0010558204|nr:prolyl 4-hydroxylase subunit alpha-1-like isoform X2 [Gouania willdenowi]